MMTDKTRNIVGHAAGLLSAAGWGVGAAYMPGGWSWQFVTGILVGIVAMGVWARMTGKNDPKGKDAPIKWGAMAALITIVTLAGLYRYGMLPGISIGWPVSATVIAMVGGTYLARRKAQAA